MSISNNSGGSANDEKAFFRVLNQSDQNDEDIVLRSRSISSASNNSFTAKFMKNYGEKKYFNLQAIDGFALLDKEMEEKPLNDTFLKKMDVDSICGSNAVQNQKNYHLEKLFHPQGPYFAQTHQYENNKRKRDKRRNRRKSTHQANFLDNIDPDIYKSEIEEDQNYRIASLFEEPEEKEVRVAKILSNKRRAAMKSTATQTNMDSSINHPYEEDKVPFEDQDLDQGPQMLKKDSLAGKMNLLNTFKDQEILNAFKLSLLHTNQISDSMSEDMFYKKVGESFISSLRKSSEKKPYDIERRLSEMNIQSDSQQDTARISDFGDIIPVNFEAESSTLRKHQKWSMAEQKKLSNFIAGRSLHEIKKDEWVDICSKLNRTQASILQKSEEITQKMTRKNKKRKITDVHPTSAHNESVSCLSIGKVNNSQTMNSFSEVDNQTDFGKSQKSDFNNISRKAIIEKALDELPSKRGSKKQIFDIISNKFEIDLINKSGSQYKGFHQTLSKCFNNSKGFYALRTTCSDYEALSLRLNSLSDCKSWKEKTFFVLNSFPSKQARLDEIKSRISILVGNSLPTNSNEYLNETNLWERNLLKIFSKYGDLFDTSNSKSIFYLC